MKSMEEYAPKALRPLENRLNLLVLVAAIAPLLGMTGTVTGMISSFDVMASSAGLDPGAVAGGIGEALITTAAGLIVAMPCAVSRLTPRLSCVLCCAEGKIKKMKNLN